MFGWIVPFLVGNGTGGLLGYFISEKFEFRRERRQARRSDLQEQLDLLLQFLGEPCAAVDSLVEVPKVDFERRRADAEAKGALVRSWVDKHVPRFPTEVQRSLFLLENVANMAARGQRHLIDAPYGLDLISDSRKALDRYVQELRVALH